MGGSSTEEGPWRRFSDDSSRSFSFIPDIRRRFMTAYRSLHGTMSRFLGNGRQRDAVTNSNAQSNVGLNQHRRINMYNRRPRGHELWLPGNRDEDDWRRCHGMSNSDYKKTKRRIRQIMRFAEEDAEEDSRRTSTMAVGFPTVSAIHLIYCVISGQLEWAP